MKSKKYWMKCAFLVALAAALCLLPACNHDTPPASFAPGLYLGDTPVADFTGEPNLTNITAWLAANAADGGDYTIRLGGPEYAGPLTLDYGDKNVTVRLTGTAAARQVTGPVFSLDPDIQGYLFTIGNDAGAGKITLVLSGDITLQGHKNNAYGLISVKSNGTLIMEGNAKITGNTHNVSAGYKGQSGGGAVSVSGTFTMRDNAEISGNAIIDGHGGGVSIYGGGVFTMEGGSVSNNSAAWPAFISPGTLTGGGVVVVSAAGKPGSRFTMTGGRISGNTLTAAANGAVGGGIYVSDSSVFIMEGDAAISGNAIKSADGSQGGGVYVGAASFTIKSGTISGNSAEAVNFAGGGGVSLNNGGDFTMEGTAVISGNTAKSTGGGAQGGGVFNGGSFTIKGGEISGNRATAPDWTGGGGVSSGNDFTMEGTAVISGNTAKSTGAGVQGGGVFIGDTGSFTMKSGIISRNAVETAAFGAGAGVGLDTNTNLNKTGGVIYGRNGGGEANTITAATPAGAAIWAKVSGGGSIKRDTTVTAAENLSKTGTSYTGAWTD
jgi:hypothetical protein